MSDTDYEDKRRSIKQKFLSRAISEGRGAVAIEKINTLYRNVRATCTDSDDMVLSRLTALGIREAAKDFAATHTVQSPFAIKAEPADKGPSTRLISPGPATIQ